MSDYNFTFKTWHGEPKIIIVRDFFGNTLNKKWIDINFILKSEHKSNSEYLMIVSKENYYGAITKSLSRYSGRLDANGNKIYENDYLRYFGDKYLVYYDEETDEFGWHEGGEKIPFSDMAQDELLKVQIDGNKYDYLLEDVLKEEDIPKYSYTIRCHDDGEGESDYFTSLKLENVIKVYKSMEKYKYNKRAIVINELDNENMSDYVYILKGYNDSMYNDRHNKVMTIDRGVLKDE